MKKLSRKGLIKKLDKIFADKVKAAGKCQLKGLDHISCNGNLQCMHIVSRKYKVLRWSNLNALAGCQAHHYWYTSNSWDWNELIRKYFPEQYDYVTEFKNVVWDKDLERVERELIDDYEERINIWINTSFL